MTIILPVGEDALRVALTTFGQHEPVAVPTETVYGLAAPLTDEEAVRRIYAVKRRPQENPLIIHIAAREELDTLATAVPDYARALAERHWPGPLTLVVPSAVDAPWATAGLATIAVRMPDHEFLRRLIRVAGPLCAPSANKSGRPSPTTAEHCAADLDGEVELIVDGGATRHGLESTVVDCTGPEPVILRPGAVTAEMIGAATTAEEEALKRSPGTRFRHYAPRARVVLVERAVDAPEGAFVIAKEETAHRPYTTAEELGRHLFRWLREADEEGAQVIAVQTVPEDGLGAAVMDRLRKAAKG